MDSIEQRITHSMERAFFASAWADMQRENGVSLSGLEIMDVLPEKTDDGAIHAARTFKFDMCAKHSRRNIVTVYAPSNQKISPENFGHYAVMQSMGHGVGLHDFDIDLAVPSNNFGSHGLSLDYAFEGGSKMTPTQILMAAKTLISTPDKWTQGAMHKDITGNACYKAKSRCHCALGALAMAQGTKLEGVTTDSAHWLLHQALPQGSVYVANYNDNPKRVHDDIMSLFDRAIQLSQGDV